MREVLLLAEKYRIVIADDEALAVMDLKEMLEGAGHEVVGVGHDGVEALDLVNATHPDVAVLDVKMPRLDGIQAAKIIAHNHVAPVVLLTAFGDEDMIQKAGKSMVFGYVMKPVDERNLFPALTIAVSQFRQRADMVHHVQHIENELAERKMVDRAKGLLMDYYHMQESEAYRRLQVISMKRGLSMSEVAQRVIKEIMARKNRKE
jgi:AmiR/NasT family two-component response regulator